MYIRNVMTTDLYTISADAPITEVVELMRVKNLKRVPVLDGERPAGIVTAGDIQKVSPTKGTALSVFEINYLLSKTTVRDAMTRNAVTISPDDLIEEAAVSMRANRVSALLVIENQKLVGIITESDIFDALINLLGARVVGTRFVINAENRPGILADVANIVSSYNANISHLAVLCGENGKSDIVIRMNTLDEEPIIKALESKGYAITSITKNRM